MLCWESSDMKSPNRAENTLILIIPHEHVTNWVLAKNNLYIFIKYSCFKIQKQLQVLASTKQWNWLFSEGFFRYIRFTEVYCYYCNVEQGLVRKQLHVQPEKLKCGRGQKRREGYLFRWINYTLHLCQCDLKCLDTPVFAQNICILRAIGFILRFRTYEKFSNTILAKEVQQKVLTQQKFFHSP